MLLLNTPHNPTGKVFALDELEQIAALCIEHDLLAVTDEVYEHLVFEGQHVPLATLPGMRDRTIVVSSGGKTFSFTGWKIGWICARPDLITAIRTAKQFLTFVSGPAFQMAMAVALDLEDDYYSRFAADMAAKRDLLCNGLDAAGFEVFVPQGTYFVNTDIGPLGGTDGVEFCLELPQRAGVVAIPTQVFYDNVDEGRSLVRFTFCKRPEVLTEAVERLATLKPRP